MPKVLAVPAFEVKVNGRELAVDHSTFTLAERRLSRVGLLELAQGDDLAPDEADVLASLVWVTLRRENPDLTIAEVYDSLTLGELRDGSPIDDDAEVDESDPEA